jgi:phosphinothricin acetyltransferase
MAAVQAIYEEAVRYGLASFEEAPPALADMLARRAKVLGQGLPWLVAELDGRVAGYAYAASYRDRSGYRYTIEDSVYVADGMQGRGVGRALLAALLERCNAGPWRQMVAVIGDSENKGSIALHESLGFRMVGTLAAVGFKLGRWVDSVYMQIPLGEGSDTLPEQD